MSHRFDREEPRDPEQVPPPSYESVTRAPSEHKADVSGLPSSGSRDSEPQRAAEEQPLTYEDATRRNAESTATAQQQTASQMPSNTTHTDRPTRTETYSDGNCSITSHFTGDSNNGVRFGYFNGSISFQTTSDGGAVIRGMGSGSSISGSQVTRMPDGSFIFSTGGGGRGHRRDNLKAHAFPCMCIWEESCKWSSRRLCRQCNEYGRGVWICRSSGVRTL